MNDIINIKLLLAGVRANLPEIVRKNRKKNYLSTELAYISGVVDVLNVFSQLTGLAFRNIYMN